MGDFDYGADLEKAYNDGYRDGQKAQWISVNDRLPPAAETVLFTGTSLVGERFRAQTGYYNLGVWVAENIGIVNATFTVTHWMPLPELPKENS